MNRFQREPEHASELPEDVVVRVQGVSKKFCRQLRRSMYYGALDLAKSLIGINGSPKLRDKEFWAVDGVSLALKRGETLGIIGGNGSGKSTLLRLIAGIFPPDTGTIAIRGRVGALIALGAGFHPHMTGRENIFLNGSILGMTQAQMHDKLADIVEFAAIGEFIDAPLATYSSGMRVRLGFAVAVHMSPDVLLVDEVLSVGDAAFRQRCSQHLRRFRDKGGGVLFVSHNMVGVQRVCDRVIWLDHGRLRTISSPERAIEEYEAQALAISRRAIEGQTLQAGPSPPRKMGLRETRFLGQTGKSQSEFSFGEPIEISVEYHCESKVTRPYFVFGLRKNHKREPQIAMVAMNWNRIELDDVPALGIVTCRLEAPELSPGVYYVQGGVLANETAQFGEKWLAPMQDLGSFTIAPGQMAEHYPGMPSKFRVSGLPPLMLKHSWTMNGVVVGQVTTPLQKEEG